MCLGVPMEVIAVDGVTARCRAKGVERDVSLFMLPDEAIAPGDHVIVHVGYALQKLSAEHAREVWDTYDSLLAHEDQR